MEVRIITGEKPKPKDIIKDFLKGGEKKSFYSNKEVDLMIDSLLEMLTDVQRLSLSEKVARCEYYVTRRERGVNESTTRKICERKFDITRQHVFNLCKTCESVFDIRNKK